MEKASEGYSGLDVIVIQIIGLVGSGKYRFIQHHFPANAVISTPKEIPKIPDTIALSSEFVQIIKKRKSFIRKNVELILGSSG